MHPQRRESSPESDLLRHITRRQLFAGAGVSLGSIALADMLRAETATPHAADPMAVREPHFAPRAKRVIFLFMAGGPSQFELFADKPKLRELSGQAPPESLMAGRQFAFLKGDEKLLGSKRAFKRYGECGMEVSELMPHTAKIVDDLCWVRSCTTEVFNHGPAKLFMNTGFQAPGRPSLGAWVTYGIGSPSKDLPGFVVLQSGPRGPRGGSALWSSGFLPTSYQGVPFRGQGDAILDLESPHGVTSDRQRQFFDLVRRLNEDRLTATADPEIQTRINAYEMAYRMQSSAPELMDIGQESQATLDAYGVTPGKGSFANNCLLARRLVERGVRFVQLYHTNWDHHGGPENLEGALEQVVREVDQPAAALVKDLEARGLLDDTLVIWGGEFGRTPMGEMRATVGRDHHVEGFTMWFAGGGTKPGAIIGATDELGLGVTEHKVHVHDLNATILHLLGFDHERLTYRFQGRDFRLTDVHGEVVEAMVA